MGYTKGMRYSGSYGFSYDDWVVCCGDEPQSPNLLSPLVEVAGQTGYVPLHGRNSTRRCQYKHPYEQCDDSYAPQELSEWMPGIQKLVGVPEKTFIFANNHWRSQTISNIRKFRIMLD